MHLHTLVINLDRDLDRWQKIHAAAEPKIDRITRIPAVYGPDLPDLACFALAASAFGVKKKGTLGTFLSHLKAWEFIAKELHETGIVLEDDANLIGFERIRTLQIPSEADLVFLNDRMSPGSRNQSDGASVECLPIIESLRTLNRTGLGVGADGYILRATGAKKLLKAVQSDLCFGHVDWRLLRYAIKESNLEGEFSGTRIDKILRDHHNQSRPPAWGIICAYCLNTPLVAFATGGGSVRNDADSDEVSVFRSNRP